MIRSIFYPSPTSNPLHNLSREHMTQALANPNGLLWVSIENIAAAEERLILEHIFHFHPLAVEDALSDGFQTPKVDDFGDYIFLVMYGLPITGPLEFEHTQELNIFLGPNYLVTVTHIDCMPAIDKVWERLARDDRLITNGSDFLCHAILDHMVDDFFPLVDHMDNEIETIEDAILANPRPETLARALELKHEIVFLRRIISPQREIINRLSRDNFPMIDRHSRIYFRDVYDHLVRVQDLSESLREVISSVLDIYLNSTSLRLNEVMKALTVVSTIFLPLTFVAGVYGMNFEDMPEISWRWGYLFVWIIFALIFAGMLAYFRKKKWF